MNYDEFKTKVAEELPSFMSENFHQGYEAKIESSLSENNITQEYLLLEATDPSKPDVEAPKMDILKIFEMGFMGFDEDFEKTMQNLAKTYEQAYRSAPLREKTETLAEEAASSEEKTVTLIPMRNNQYLISGDCASDKIYMDHAVLSELAEKKDKDIFIILVDKNNFVAEPVESVSEELYDFYSFGSQAFSHKEYKDFGKLLLFKKEGRFLENRAEIIDINDLGKKARAI